MQSCSSEKWKCWFSRYRATLVMG